MPNGARPRPAHAGSGAPLAYTGAPGVVRRSELGQRVMEFYELLTTRRTVHDYEPRPLPQGALERALAAALTAPNHRLTEPWRFVVVGPQTREQLVQVSVQLKAGPGVEPKPELVQNTRRKLLSAAQLVVVSVLRTPDPETAREDYAAVACAIQNFSLALWGDGIGSKWSTGGVTRAPASYGLLGIDESKEEIVGFVWAGYAAQLGPKAKRRLAVQDVVRQVP